MKSVLSEAGLENAEREAEWLLETATRRPRGELLAAAKESVSEVTERRALKLAARRAAGEPLQYITGVAGFRHLELAVGPGVFIPRPETELVAERALRRLPQGGTLVDVGTGSGAIAVAVATERPDAVVIGTESSPEAMEWAEANRTKLAPGVRLVHADLLTGLPDELRRGVDVVVSNPPYVAIDEADRLAEDVRAHEPHLALFAGLEGLLILERLVSEARDWLRPGGWLVMEVGPDQASKVAQLLTRASYEEVEVNKDLADRDRIIEARLPE